MTDETINARPANPAAEPYLRLAKHFENAAETYREVRLHGPANDAEARKGVCEFLSSIGGTDKRAVQMAGVSCDQSK